MHTQKCIHGYSRRCRKKNKLLCCQHKKNQPTLISVLCMANRVLNYHLFCRHKMLDPPRIHADYKKCSVSPHLLHPNSIEGLDTAKPTSHEAHENAAWAVVVLKRLRTVDPEDLWQVSVQSVSTSFSSQVWLGISEPCFEWPYFSFTANRKSLSIC